MEGILRVQREVISVQPEVLGSVAGMPITNTFTMILLVVLLVLVVVLVVVPRFSLVPNATQNVFELAYEGMIGLVEQITGSRERAEAIFPVIGALFVFIGISNMINLIPGFSALTWGGLSLFRTPTSDFNTTFGLALGMLVLVQVASLRSWGVVGYIGRFIKIKEVYQGFKKGLSEGGMAVVEFFIGLLDIVSELAKVVSLSFRLFGNMFAGEVLAILLLGSFAYFVPALWLSMNLLFAVVQAIVFGALATAYYSLAVYKEEGRNT